MVRPLIAAFILCASASAASAQTYPATPGWHVPQGPTATADRHNYEMDRLRANAERQTDLARDVARERRMILDRQAVSAPVWVAPPPAARALRSPEDERALREGATARREQVERGVGQIDAWLDRPRGR